MCVCVCVALDAAQSEICVKKTKLPLIFVSRRHDFEWFRQVGNWSCFGMSQPGSTRVSFVRGVVVCLMLSISVQAWYVLTFMFLWIFVFLHLTYEMLIVEPHTVLHILVMYTRRSL